MLVLGFGFIFRSGITMLLTAIPFVSCLLKYCLQFSIVTDQIQFIIRHQSSQNKELKNETESEKPCTHDQQI